MTIRDEVEKLVYDAIGTNSKTDNYSYADNVVQAILSLLKDRLEKEKKGETLEDGNTIYSTKDVIWNSAIDRVKELL